MGKDYSKLKKKIIIDQNGNRRTVYVKTEEAKNQKSKSTKVYVDTVTGNRVKVENNRYYKWVGIMDGKRIKRYWREVTDPDTISKINSEVTGGKLKEKK